MSFSATKMRDSISSEIEIRRYRAKAQQYRDEAKKELNVHMKAALESIARGYDTRADKMKATKIINV